MSLLVIDAGAVKRQAKTVATGVHQLQASLSLAVSTLQPRKRLQRAEHQTGNPTVARLRHAELPTTRLLCRRATVDATEITQPVAQACAMPRSALPQLPPGRR